MADVNRRYFDNLMRDAGLSLRGLAARMGMAHSQLSLTFSGDRKMQLDEAVQLSSIFGQPLAKIIEAMGVPVAMAGDVRVPVIGSVLGDGTVQAGAADAPERTLAPGGMPDDTVAVQCRTAGSPLDWADGFVLFCRDAGGRLDPEVGGRFALVQIASGPLVVASVRRGYRDGTYNLRGFYQADSVRLEWGTPVIWTRN